jgi:putative RNA 2'-phosphotransferase
MNERRRKKISKYLSKHLRHQPERLGLHVQPGGWVEVAELLRALAAQRFSLTREELEEVVHGGEKPRFSFDDSGRRIRANYGHSIPVELELAPAHPPDTLYHGTAEQRLDAILANGLHPMGRRYVHLYEEPAGARAVGARHGSPVLLEVEARRLAEAGQPFYSGADRIWLVERVPPEYLRRTG